MINRWLLLGVLVCAPLLSIHAQITDHYDSAFTYREVVDEICDDPNNMCHYNKEVSWNDSQIQEYTYRRLSGSNVIEFMNWRMVFPANYDPNRTEAYPVILMLHGGGESGRKWGGTTFLPTEDRFDNNGKNLIHGGQAHLNAVNRNPALSNAFPGIVIWPQVSYNGAWESGWENGNLSANARMTIQILEWVIQRYNIDPDRISMHGLSNGAKGSWDLASKRPDLFAAVLPMSGVGSNLEPMTDALVTTPLWLFQGGTDTNPRQQAAEDWIAKLLEKGAAPRYTLYPNLGHGVWNTAYAEPDFWSWMLAQDKKNIYVFGGDPNICPGGSVKLGVSDNFAEYQWRKNGVPIPGATTRYLTVTDPDTYDVQFKRQFGPDVWVTSNALVVGEKGASTFSPTLTNTGSTVLPIKRGGNVVGGVNNVITFTADPGYTTYYWFKNEIPMSPATTSTNTRSISNNNGSASDAGIYTVKVLEGTGCISTPSNAITVTWNDPQPATPQPSTPVMTGLTSTSIKIVWNDVAGENAYEIWRYRFNDSGYNWGTGLGGYPIQAWRLITILPANTTTYTDEGLRPEAGYRYMVRALHSSGGGTFSSEPNVNGNPLADSTPPTTPQDFVVSDIRDTQATFSWTTSFDNDVVYKYQLFNGSNKIDIAGGKDIIADTVFNGAPLYDQDLTNGNPAPPTTYILKNLTPLTTYFISVRAMDYKGNVSPFSEVIPITTGVPDQNGLAYKYYETSSSIGTVGNFDFNQTPKKSGYLNVDNSGSNGAAQQNNYSASLLAPRDRNTNIVFSFESKIQIDIAGEYTFYTTSDDGSRLFINDQEVVNNDGAHGMQERSGSYEFDLPGRYDFRVIFAQGGGGYGLHLRYEGPGGSGISKQLIPNDRFWRPGADPTIVYYLKATAGNDLTNLSNWGTNTDGTGTSPSDFTSDYQKFVINNSSPSLIEEWTVEGIGSKVVIDNEKTLTISLLGNLNGTLEANENTFINLNSEIFPTFGILSETSTLNFNSPINAEFPTGSFGNVNLNSNSSTISFPVNATIIKRDLEVSSNTTITGATNNDSKLYVGGNITFHNNNPFPATTANQYSLVFTGGNSHNVIFENPINPNLFSIQVDYGDSVAFSNLSGNTFTVGSAQGGGLTLKGGASLNLGNNNLTIAGRGTVNTNNETGDLIMDGGNFSLSTTATQNSNIYFAGSNVNNFTTSTPDNNRVSLLSALNVKNLVTVSNGELNADIGNLILRSTSDDSSGTARIGPLLGSAKISGSITMERFMSGEGRIYRYISSPVKGTTAEDLQAFFPITGNFTGTSTGPGLSTNASMFAYSEPTYAQFPAVGGTNLDTLKRGKGYVPFIREANDSTVWSVTGEPYQGDIPFTLTGGSGSESDGWNLLGNPYPAPIQWTGNSSGGWNISGISNTVYVLENSNEIEGGSAWRFSNGSIGTFDGVIAPGQAFWVRTTTGSPSITISESAKQTLDSDFFRSTNPDNTLEIAMTSPQSEDVTFIGFDDEATAAFDTNLDGVKRENAYFNLSSLTSDGKPMVINLTTPEYCSQEFKLRTANAPEGSYSLTVNGADRFINGDVITLIDNLTETETIISSSETINFSITSEPESKIDGRFVLRIERPEVNLQAVVKSETLCDETTAMVKIIDAQVGMHYQAFHNNTAISDEVLSIGGTLEIPVSSPELNEQGSITATVIAGFKGCNSVQLNNSILISKTAFIPEVIVQPDQLTASIDADEYQWYYQGEKMTGENDKNLLSPQGGEYFVEATIDNCTLKSESAQFRITGFEESTLHYSLSPNPTKGKVVVVHESITKPSAIRVISTIGKVQSVAITAIDNTHTEIDLSPLSTGLYVVLLNGRHYRVIKE